MARRATALTEESGGVDKRRIEAIAARSVRHHNTEMHFNRLGRLLAPTSKLRSAFAQRRARVAFGARIAVSVLLMAFGASAQRNYVNSELPWHNAVTDSQNRLLAWYQPEANLGYDKVLRLAWDYLEHKIPTDAKSGLKVYLVNAVYDAKTGQGTNWQGNPASTFGQFVDSAVAWYPYSGDRESIDMVRSMLDYQLAHGTTPADWDWARVPFATNCKNEPEYGGCVQDTPAGFRSGIETDKLGELGTGYVLFYELTGDRKYLDAAIWSADALAKHMRPGDADHTPWAFRVDAKTGDVLNGEEYGGMIVAPVRLFSELIRLKQGDTARYAQARDAAWAWIMKYPMHNDRWSGYFEDVHKNPQNVNQASPTMTAYYILTSPDPAAVDPQWNGDVGHMIDWVRHKFGRGPYFGAWAIDEQGVPPDYTGCCSRAGLASDTSRWAAINAMYYEKTGDGQAKEDAFRSLNFATYFADNDGRIACCGLDYAHSYWFDDGYSDYIRNFLWAMGAIPEFAPVGQNHLLRSSSVVQKVDYETNSISYETFDADATEVVRLNQAPAHVSAGGSDLTRVDVLKPGGYTVRNLSNGGVAVDVQHAGARDVVVSW